MFDELVKKFNAIKTNELKTNCNAKINKNKCKIRTITRLATTVALNTVEHKITMSLMYSRKVIVTQK